MKQYFNFRTALVVAITMIAVNTNAQKTGTLKKDQYFTVPADDVEGYLDGKNSGEFEKKSTIPLATWLGFVKNFTATTLGEPSIQSAKANSMIRPIPAGTDVYTQQADGSWITRKAYPNETSFYHVPTGIYWLSLACLNLVNITIKPATTPTTTTPVFVTTTPTTTGPGSITLTNTNTPASQQLSKEISVGEAYMLYQLGQKDFYTAYKTGQSDFQNGQVHTALLLKAAQDSKECCGNTTTTVAPTQGFTYSGMAMQMQQPMVVYAGNQQNTKQKIPFGQTWFGNYSATTLANVTSDVIADVFNIGGCNHKNGYCSGACGGSINGGVIYTQPFHAATPAGGSSASLIPGGNGNTGGNNLGFQWKCSHGYRSGECPFGH